MFTLVVDRGLESAPGTFDGHWQEQKPNNKSQDYVYAMILSARLEVLYGRPRLFPLKYGLNVGNIRHVLVVSDDNVRKVPFLVKLGRLRFRL